MLIHDDGVGRAGCSRVACVIRLNIDGGFACCRCGGSGCAEAKARAREHGVMRHGEISDPPIAFSTLKRFGDHYRRESQP